MIVSLIAAVSATGLFRRVPSYGLDGVATSTVFGYGAFPPCCGGYPINLRVGNQSLGSSILVSP